MEIYGRLGRESDETNASRSYVKSLMPEAAMKLTSMSEAYELQPPTKSVVLGRSFIRPQAVNLQLKKLFEDCIDRC